MAKKIKRIHLHNFQSHTDISLEIAPMLTTIVGASDAGKSAVIRALRWALFNEPAGTQFMRVGTRDTHVRIEFTDGSSLLRARDKSENYYILQTGEEEEPVRLEGFGQLVPKEVTDFTGIRKIKIGEKESLAVNLAGQLEGPFLLGEKPSVRAEAIGRLAGTDRIDAAHRTTNADKFNNQRRIGQLTLDAQRLEEQLAAFSDLPEKKKRIDRLQQTLVAIEQAQERLMPLKRLKQQLSDHTAAMDATRRRLDSYAGIEASSERYRLASEAFAQKSQLDRWYKRLQNNRSAANKEREEFSAASRLLDYVQTTQVLQKSEQWLKLKTLAARHTALRTEASHMQKKTDVQVEEAIALYTRLNASLHRLNDFGRLRDALEDKHRRLQTGARYLEGRKHVDTAQDRLRRSLDVFSKTEALRRIRNRYESVGSALAAAEKSLLSCNETLQHALDAYVSLMSEAKQCPYCLQPLDAGSLQHLRTHMESDRQ